jgi:hypothetical protein
MVALILVSGLTSDRREGCGLGRPRELKLDGAISPHDTLLGSDKDRVAFAHEQAMSEDARDARHPLPAVFAGEHWPNLLHQ